MSADNIRDSSPAAADDSDTAIAELNRALEANPDLRGKTPRPPKDEWEDFDKLLAENPELAAPVPSTKPGATAFYYSKDKWDCEHDGEPAKTEIERLPIDGEQDGKNPETGEYYEDAILVNAIRGICPKCLNKWTVPGGDEAGEQHQHQHQHEQASSSRDPADFPIAEPLPKCVLDIDRDDDDIDSSGGVAGVNRGMSMLEIDDSPDKNKSPPGPDSDSEYTDDDDLPPPPGNPPAPGTVHPDAAPPAGGPPPY